MAIIFDKTQDTAAEVAEYICQKFAAGLRGKLSLAGLSFELTDIAKCSEFVRECCEAAAGTGDHTLPYFGGDARETEAKLKAAGKECTGVMRGDIICFNKGNAGKWGHIGLALGKGLFAENTSSATRGPGFVISRLDAMEARVSGYYSLLPARKPKKLEFIPRLIAEDGKVICEGKMIDGELWVPVRKTLVAVGKDVAWHPEQNKGYVIDGKAD